MIGNFTILSKYGKKILKWFGIGLLIVFLTLFIGFEYVNRWYTNFCNSTSITLDITDSTSRLGGIGNIGIGSTRQEIINAVERRNILNSIFHDQIPPAGYIFFSEPFNLSGSTLGFYRTRRWNAIEFLFDENDRVTKIRITPMH